MELLTHGTTNYFMGLFWQLLANASLLVICVNENISIVIMIFFYYFIQNYRFWDRFDTDQVWVKTVQYLGPEWDVYIISLLAGLLVILLLFRRAMTNQIMKSFSRKCTKCYRCTKCQSFCSTSNLIMYYFFEIFEEFESCFERHEFCTLAPLVLGWFVEL